MRYALRLCLLLLAALPLLACAQHLRLSGDTPPLAAPQPGALRVASYNVHYINLNAAQGRWSVPGWLARRGALDAAFMTLDADIVAFQEMESFSRGSDGSVNLARDHLLAQNPDYAAAASGDWRSFPSTQPIFYRPAVLELRDEGWFFFSPTPDVIYAPTFNGGYPAFASWAVFAPRDGGPELRVVNVHFAYGSRSNRLQSAALVRDRIAPHVAAGQAVVLAGDLNALHGARTMRILEEAGLGFPRVPGASYHLDRGLHLFGAIDHIGLGPGVSVAAPPVVLQRAFDGVWPSDHHPVLADIRIPP